MWVFFQFKGGKMTYSIMLKYQCTKLWMRSSLTSTSSVFIDDLWCSRLHEQHDSSAGAQAETLPTHSSFFRWTRESWHFHRFITTCLSSFRLWCSCCCLLHIHSVFCFFISFVLSLPLCPTVHIMRFNPFLITLSVLFTLLPSHPRVSHLATSAKVLNAFTLTGSFLNGYSIDFSYLRAALPAGSLRSQNSLNAARGVCERATRRAHRLGPPIPLGKWTFYTHPCVTSSI